MRPLVTVCRWCSQKASREVVACPGARMCERVRQDRSARGTSIVISGPRQRRVERNVRRTRG